ncbi:MAG: phosphodiester glycosidase family protein [Chloroflexota bacterium]|nr:phosphodiester glycosidase family protein [Chloroflexota bacterium]
MRVGEIPFQSNEIRLPSIAEVSSSLNKLDVDAFVQGVRRASIGEATELLRDLILKEQFLSENNSLEAYTEKLPLVLESLEVSFFSEVAGRLEATLLRKALFGNFRAVSDTRLVEILESIRPAKTAEVFDEMVFGVDMPKKAARALSDMSAAKVAMVVSLMSDHSVLRCFLEMRRSAKARILEMLDTERAFEVCVLMLGDRNEVRLARVAAILKEMEEERSFALWSRFDSHDWQKLNAMKWPVSAWDSMNLRKAVSCLSGMSPSQAAEILGRVSPERQLEIFRHLESDFVAEVLDVLVSLCPLNVKAILEEMAVRVLIPNSVSSPRDEVYSDRAPYLRKNMGIDFPASRKNTAVVFSSYPRRSGSGMRRSKNLGYGMKAIHIEESLKTESRIKHILIDLLELDPACVQMKCCRSISKEDLVPIKQIEERLRDIGWDNPTSKETAFGKLGLVRLAEVVEKSGAIAGINGGFYFDYGHYRDSQKIGLNLSQIPGLCYGDLIGWFVSDGTESSPPIVNRASLVVTKAGAIHIVKVFMTEVVLPNGNSLEWDGINTKREGEKTILFNSEYGLTTKVNDHYIDVAISRNIIYDIVRGGGATIPISGFILSLPRENWKLLEGLAVGNEVEIKNNFPKGLGEVEQAMSCGPQLVRDSQLEIDFDFEDFGEKDSLVVPFSLTRAVDIFDAARSFIMLKGEKLYMGVVSGTLFGSGTPNISAGMTFGELAQLTLDLGAEQALALDGGGSSSIVARTLEGVKVLNIPTGGSDVPQGRERFINTYWLAFPASEKVKVC